MAIGAKDLHARLSALPGSGLEHPFYPEVEVYKVAGKVFAMFVQRGEDLRITLKGDPVLNEALREAHPAIEPGYHTDKRHWNTVRLDGRLEDSLVWDLVDGSYDIVRAKLPKRLREGLGPRV